MLRILSNPLKENFKSFISFIILLLKSFQKRLQLERENAKLKRELESTNAQITTLKEEMSFIKNYDNVILLSDNISDQSTST